MTRPMTVFDIIQQSIEDLWEVNILAVIPGIIFAIIFSELALPGFIAFNLVMGTLAVRKNSTYTTIEDTDDE